MCDICSYRRVQCEVFLVIQVRSLSAQAHGRVMSRVPVKNGSFQNGGPSVQWSQFQPPKHTAIPLREQCRIRRFFFFYHDIRAFTTSVSVPGNSRRSGWRRETSAARVHGLGARCRGGLVRARKRVTVYEDRSIRIDELIDL